MQREHVAHALRLLREQRGMTQAEVAERAGCTKARISAYERGRRTLYVDTLFRLLDAMGWRAHDFGRRRARRAAPAYRVALRSTRAGVAKAAPDRLAQGISY